MRIPEHIKAQLPRDYFGIGVWIRAAVEVRGETHATITAFDVFRIIVAVQCDGFVGQLSVNYDDLCDTRSPLAMIRAAAERGIDYGWDRTDYADGLEELLGGYDRVIDLPPSTGEPSLADQMVAGMSAFCDALASGGWPEVERRSRVRDVRAATGTAVEPGAGGQGDRSR